jgi:hypothetical protein
MIQQGGNPGVAQAVHIAQIACLKVDLEEPPTKELFELLNI